MSTLLVIGTLGAVGCAGPLIESGGFHVSKKWFEEDVQRIKPQAAFALSCSQEQIEFVVLAVSDAGPAPAAIGANGCGKKLVYVCTMVKRCSLGATENPIEINR